MAGKVRRREPHLMLTGQKVDVTREGHRLKNTKRNKARLTETLRDCI
jgi:hypothetical protein